jgi:hypothetical protein
MNHLEELGYIKRIQKRGEHGYYGSVDLLLYDEPNLTG